ncbi:MAG TPA: hypothetical protein VF557_06610 [Jatrophihabitans sp.]|uniref:hypothetical protein n=1 Tax=Jatrophihabitans sp. TaxID=1932789 RepID=UPI002EEA6EDC
MVLPTAQPFRGRDAHRWVAAGLPRGVTSVALPLLWGVALLVAASTGASRCMPQHLAGCGPDASSTLWLVMLLATPVLLVWMPVLGCLAAVAYALTGLSHEDMQVARVVFGLHGLLCALAAVRLVLGVAEQRRIAAAASGGLQASAGHLPTAPEDGGHLTARQLAPAGALALAGLGLLAWSGQRNSVGWQSAGAGCFLLALVWLLHHWRLRQGVAALRRGDHPALRVKMRLDDKGRALILPVLGSNPAWLAKRPIARLAVAAALPQAVPAAAGTPAESAAEEESDDAERLLPQSGTVQDAVLLGELNDRGIAMLITSDAVLLPAGRLRTSGVLERGPGGDAMAAGGGGDGGWGLWGGGDGGGGGGDGGGGGGGDGGGGGGGDGGGGGGG